MGVQRFEVGAVNDLQTLTGGGANYQQMGLEGFKPQAPEVSAPKPALDVGGMKP